MRQCLSDCLHSRWRSESVNITLTDVDVSPDLRNASVYFSVLGSREDSAKALKFLLSIRNELRFLMGKEVILKYTPALNFILDNSISRGMRVMDLLDELDETSPLADEDDDNPDQNED